MVAGAGSAGLGVAEMLVEGMVQQGLSPEEARARFYICDAEGLIGGDRLDGKVPPFPQIRTSHPFSLGF